MTTQTQWAIDSTHSEIAFKIRHLMIAHVRGTFKTFDATIITTNRDFTTVEVDLRIAASSIQTGDKGRDEHLMSKDFFDVQNHKEIVFRCNTISKEDADGNHEMWGELTIKNITKKVKMDVEFGGISKDPWGNEKAGFTVTGKLNRSDWGLTWNTPLDSGGVMVSDEVQIACELELVNKGLIDLKIASADSHHAPSFIL